MLIGSINEKKFLLESREFKMAVIDNRCEGCNSSLEEIESIQFDECDKPSKVYICDSCLVMLNLSFKCENCEEVIWRIKPWQKFCSDSCRVMAHEKANRKNLKELKDRENYIKEELVKILEDEAKYLITFRNTDELKFEILKSNLAKRISRLIGAGLISIENLSNVIKTIDNK